MSLPNAILPELSITGLSKRIFFVDGFVSVGLIAALRVSKRLYLEVIREKGPVRRGKNALIVGAGNAGEMMLRDIARHGYKDYYPLGFLDDDSTKAGSYIHGVKVLGPLKSLEGMVLKHRVQAVLIAIPTLNHKNRGSVPNYAKSMWHSGNRFTLVNFWARPSRPSRLL